MLLSLDLLLFRQQYELMTQQLFTQQIDIQTVQKQFYVVLKLFRMLLKQTQQTQHF